MSDTLFEALIALEAWILIIEAIPVGLAVAYLWAIYIGDAHRPRNPLLLLFSLTGTIVGASMLYISGLIVLTRIFHATLPREAGLITGLVLIALGLVVPYKALAMYRASR